MKVEYKTNKLRRECTERKAASRAYGEEMAEKIMQRVKQIRSFPTVEMLIENSVGRCHPLKGNRKGEYAMDLIHPYRLVFLKTGDTIQIARITAIEDYH